MLKSTVSGLCIINGKVEFRAFYLSDLIQEADGMKYYVMDYGQGSVWWSVIDDASQAYTRQLADDLKWAKNRIIWAKENAPKEVAELQLIIDSNGYARNPALLKKLKEYSETHAQAL